MARLDPYVTLAQFKARIGTAVNQADDQLTLALQGASRIIDGWLGLEPGHFNQGEAGEVRYFSGDWIRYPDRWAHRRRDILHIDPVVTITAVGVDDGSRTWADAWVADTDYQLGPLTAPALTRPYTDLVALGGNLWPVREEGIRVTGTFGWPEVPAEIREATFHQANRMKSSWTAPFGVAGSGETGEMRVQIDLTPKIQAMIAHHRRLVM